MSGLINVLVVEDHLITRLGLTMFLKQSASIAVVGEAADGLSALQMIEQTAPDVVLMDIGLPGIDGVECVRRLRGENLKTRVVMRSSHQEIGAILGALAAGADGFSSKDSSDDLLLLAIKHVAADRAWIDPCIAREILSVFGPASVNRNPKIEVKSPMPVEEVALLERIASASTQELDELAAIDPTNSLANLMAKYGNLYHS